MSLHGDAKAVDLEVEDLTPQWVVRRADKAKLLPTGWPEWKRFREARDQTAHTDRQEKAVAVIETAREFLPEADNLSSRLTERMAI